MSELQLIDPTDITNYHRSNDDLELFWIFSIMVAGKKSDVTVTKVHNLVTTLFTLDLKKGRSRQSPLSMIDQCYNEGSLIGILHDIRVGQYNRIYNAMSQSSALVKSGSLSLSDCTPFELEQINGIGPKTARFFILHSRENVQYAALDTHILHWLRDQGYDAPKSTPTGKTYERLETIFLQEATNRSLSPSEFDLMIWKQYSKKSN